MERGVARGLGGAERRIALDDEQLRHVVIARLAIRKLGWHRRTGSKRGYKEQSARVLEKIVGEMHARIQARKTKEVTRRKNALES